MAKRIEALPLGVNLGQRQLGQPQTFRAYLWCKQPLAIRAGNATATIGTNRRQCRAQRLGMGHLRGHIAAAHQAVHRHHIAAALAGDEAGDVGGIAHVARPAGDMHIDALGVQRAARQRHPVFPAIQAADAEASEREHAQAVAIAQITAFIARLPLTGCRKTAVARRQSRRWT